MTGGGKLSRVYAATWSWIPCETCRFVSGTLLVLGSPLSPRSCVCLSWLCFKMEELCFNLWSISSFKPNT